MLLNSSSCGKGIIENQVELSVVQKVNEALCYCKKARIPHSLLRSCRLHSWSFFCLKPSSIANSLRPRTTSHSLGCHTF